MIYFLRHAEGTGQAPEAPLAPEGHAAARALVPTLEGLAINAVWSSPYARARETVAPFAAAAGLPIHEDDRLSERRHGPVPDGMWGEEARQLFADPNAAPFGGESRNDLIARAEELVADILAEPGTTLVGCHGFWLATYLSTKGAPATEAFWRAIKRPALFAVRVDGFEEIPL